MTFAQFWQSHIALPYAPCSWSGSKGSQRRPEGETAAMWTASPRVRLCLRSLWGPLVSARHFGFEQRSPARAAVAHVTASVKASVWKRAFTRRRGPRPARSSAPTWCRSAPTALGLPSAPSDRDDIQDDPRRPACLLDQGLLALLCHKR